jgi:hypothetical protein
MFRINFQESEGEGQLNCPFCNGQYGLPLGIQLLRDTTDPSGPDVIREHYDPGVPDDTETIERCPRWNFWRDCRWEVFEADSSRVLAAGNVHVAKNGSIEVRTDDKS